MTGNIMFDSMLPLLILLLATGGLVLILFHLDYRFVVRIRPGKAVCVKGKVSRQFLQDCRLITRRRAVRGWVYGARTTDGVMLEFSSSLSAADAQRIRNVFPFSSYSIPGKSIPENRLHSKR